MEEYAVFMETFFGFETITVSFILWNIENVFGWKTIRVL